MGITNVMNELWELYNTRAYKIWGVHGAISPVFPWRTAMIVSPEITAEWTAEKCANWINEYQ